MISVTLTALYIYLSIRIIKQEREERRQKEEEEKKKKEDKEGEEKEKEQSLNDSTMRKRNIEPKRIRFVHPSEGKAPNLVLVQGTKGGKPFLKVEDPIYVYDKDGKYTCTIMDIYNMQMEEE